MRTSEAVSAGTEFYGVVRLKPGAPEWCSDAMRLCLLTLEAVGGNRNRGAGACLVNLAEGEDNLESLAKSVEGVPWDQQHLVPIRDLNWNHGGLPLEPIVWLRLVFEASEPVCCPETVPGTNNNVVTSGVSIPASAVWGAVLTLLSKKDPASATQAFLDERARAWPLNPLCGVDEIDPGGIPTRVSLSHRLSKLADVNGVHSTEDGAIAPYSWQDVPEGSPLKGSDGSLLRMEDPNGAEAIVQIWRAGDMPRVLTSHAVHRGERNLFTVESLAPMKFAGLICLPKTAADQLVTVLASDASVAIGKSRSVRGGGELKAVEVDPVKLFSAHHRNVWVLQSPATIPDEWIARGTRSETNLRKLIQASGIGKPKDLDNQEAGVVKVDMQAACGVRFGWNRSGRGARVSGTGRLQAKRVFLPGSVFVLEEPVEPQVIAKILSRGLGDSRMEGFGALLPHPGIAKHIKTRSVQRIKMESSQAGEWAVRWFENAGRGNGPSPSQISAVASRIHGGDGTKAIEFLKVQKKDRPERVWGKWYAVHSDLLECIHANPEVARNALRTWRDLAVNQRKDKEDRA